MKKIRILAEHGVAIWNSVSGLTVNQAQVLEKIQKVALKIILSDEYLSYENARAKFGLQLLSDRRLGLCTNYALKLYKSKYCNNFYSPVTHKFSTRHKNLVVEPLCNTKEMLSSSPQLSS